MEEVPVVIVGAGPSGLAMGLSLAKYRTKVRRGRRGRRHDCSKALDSRWFWRKSSTSPQIREQFISTAMLSEYFGTWAYESSSQILVMVQFDSHCKVTMD